MKAVLAIWLLCAGLGVSYSIMMERKKQVEVLRAMEQDLKRFAYYMCEWRMPVEEVLNQMIKGEGYFKEFYRNIHKSICEKRIADFGVYWYEESRCMWLGTHIQPEIKNLWEACFLHMPTEPEAMKRYLHLKSEALAEKRMALEERYKGEQRLVLSMGFFVSAFLCLILW